VAMLEQISRFGGLQMERVDQGFMCPIQPGLHILEHNRGGLKRTACIRGQVNGDVRCLVPTTTNMVLYGKTDSGVETLYHDPIFRKPETCSDLSLHILEQENMDVWRNPLQED
jgi:hypothetical protein